MRPNMEDFPAVLAVDDVLLGQYHDTPKARLTGVWANSRSL